MIFDPADPPPMRRTCAVDGCDAPADIRIGIIYGPIRLATPSFGDMIPVEAVAGFVDCCSEDADRIAALDVVAAAEEAIGY